MIGSQKPVVLAEFYSKVFQKSPDWNDGSWHGWNSNGIQLTIGEHSEVNIKAKEPQRLIMNLETDDVKKEFERIKKLEAQIIKDPYEMEGMWIATFADPDGNYFQLMSPWSKNSK